MRSPFALALLALSACTAVPAESVERSGGECRSEGLGRYVGQAGTEANGAAILRDSGAKTLRWIAQGSVVTMEFSSERVNVKLDAQNRIEAVTCG
ncbi:MAG: peptidase inhibitor I78 [Sphingomonas sp.]|nr:peptidase inhibitor I78 [Sphingomonas sp.]